MSQKGKPAERLGFDARGIPRWDQRTRTGEYVPKPSDSLITRALKADDITLADTRRNRILPNPYGTQTSEKSLKSRNSLDYMRALSEAMKAQRRLESNDEVLGPWSRLKRFLGSKR